MNFAQMLATRVTPLSEVTPSSKLPPERKPVAVALSKTTNRTRHDHAMKRVRTVLGTEWRSTSALGIALNMSNAGNLLPTLRKWHKQGLIERRLCHTNPKGGYQWRFADGDQ